MGGDSFSVRLGHNRDLMVTLTTTRSWLWPSLTKNLTPDTVLRILPPFLYQTVALFNVQKVKPIWRALENLTTRSLLWPSGHNHDLVVISVTIRSWLWPNLKKSISSHSFDNFLTIPLPNSSSLQCAKNSAYLESLRHMIWILAKFLFRLGHNRDLILIHMT